MQNDERKSDTGDLRTWKRKDRKCLRTRCDRSLKGKTVIMVQFLKGSMETEGMEIVKRLEPEFKLFRFENHPSF